MPGLYVHLPFCRKKCHYCNFVIAIAKDGSEIDLFLDLLSREIAQHAAGFTGIPFESLYVGGGTPSLFEEKATRDFFKLLRGAFSFRKDAEITWEANPGDVTRSKAALYRELGINRISLGVQSFNDATLRAINRTHLSLDIAESFKLFRESGFDNISLDLMLSLPGESVADVLSSVQGAIDLGPEHISLYELTIEEKTVFGQRLKQGRLRLPPEEAQLEMLTQARALFKKAGYEHYELLSYAKPGFRSRHNLLYWANESYLGLGPGAFSYVEGRRYQYADSVDAYVKKVSAGDWSAHEEERLTAEQKEIESLLLALRLIEGADLCAFQPVLARLKDPLTKLEKQHLLERSAGKLCLTPRGQLFAESVFTELSSI